jgi:predicted peroxiredoxin
MSTPTRALLTLLTLLLSLSALPLQAADASKRMFINLTSDDTDRAAMAIKLAQNVLAERKIPVTIFLNVEGVRIANKAIPQNKHLDGKTNQELLREFMKNGGRVIICPLCMDNIGGFGRKDLMKGVEMGGPGVTFPALLDGDVVVLSY